MCIPDHSCFSHIPKDTLALPSAGSAPTAGSSMWAGSLKQLENEPSRFFFAQSSMGITAQMGTQQASLPWAQQHNDPFPSWLLAWAVLGVCQNHARS